MASQSSTGNEHKAVTECSSSNSDVEVYCESAQPNKKHQGDTEYVYVDEERVFGESKDADQAKGDEAEKLAVPSEVKVDQHESNTEYESSFETTVIAMRRLPEESLKLHPSNFGEDGGPVCGGFCCCRKPIDSNFAQSVQGNDEEGLEMHPLGVSRQNTEDYAQAPPGSGETPVMESQGRCSIRWCGWVRRLVSKKKRRYIGDGFDLDLTYVLNNVIAMGFPSVGKEAIYRNPRDELQHFLTNRYGTRYRIYNLCCESQHQYDPSAFSDRVGKYPFEDHNAPPMNTIFRFCDDMYRFLLSHKNNVAIIHCKAGKGRTGQMVCCYLLHCGAFSDPEECMQFYAWRRTFNSKGVTIPSQRRYIYYYYLQLRAIRYKKLFISHFQQGEKQIENAAENKLISEEQDENLLEDTAENKYESEEAQETGATTVEGDHSLEEKKSTGSMPWSQKDPLGAWILNQDPRSTPKRNIRVQACSFIGNPGPYEALGLKILQRGEGMHKTTVCSTFSYPISNPFLEVRDLGLPKAAEVLPLSPLEEYEGRRLPRACGVLKPVEKDSLNFAREDPDLPAGPPFQLVPENKSPKAPLPSCADAITFQQEDLSEDYDGVLISGDVLVELWGVKQGKKSKKVCSFWLNTAFLPMHPRDGEPQGHSRGHIVLPKLELDKAVKDKKHKRMSADFCCLLLYRQDGQL